MLALARGGSEVQAPAGPRGGPACCGASPHAPPKAPADSLSRCLAGDSFSPRARPFGRRSLYAIMQLIPAPPLSSPHPRHRRPPPPHLARLTPPKGGTHIAHTVRNALSEEADGGAGTSRAPRVGGARLEPPHQPLAVGGESEWFKCLIPTTRPPPLSSWDTEWPRASSPSPPAPPVTPHRRAPPQS